MRTFDSTVFGSPAALASARVTFTTTIELSESDRPALVATHISLYRFQQEEP
jgi:hypothetical protein